MKRQIILFLAISFVAVGIAVFSGCSQTSQTATTTSQSTTTTAGGPTASISIASFAFHPNILTVEAGTTVTWTNNDSFSHSVISNAGPASFSSSIFSPGSTYFFQFTLVGTYEYHCGVHPTMTGTIIVQ